MPSTRNLSRENLRRSSRAELLRKKAEAQKAQAVTIQPMKGNKKKKKATPTPLKKTKYRTKTTGKSHKTLKPAEGNDDGFIPDDDPPASTSRQQFDELEIWKQYQQFPPVQEGDEDDDGFIPDDEEVHVKSTQPAKEGTVSYRGRRLEHLWKEEVKDKGKKLSKKKRKRAEKKWLKKLFQESVIIAEPNETDNGGEASAHSEEQESITIPILSDREKENSQNEDVMDSTINGGTHDSHLPHPSTSNAVNFSEQTVGHNGLNNLEPSSNDIQKQLDYLKSLSGLSDVGFTHQLLKLYRKDLVERQTRQGVSAPNSVDQSKDADVSTRFVDLTSGNSESDDRKKRYKMELSIPEGTTILVTNMVKRDTPLPKVIFMLKKTAKDGETPLLMECAGQVDKNQGQRENQKALQRELAEITRQFIEKPNGSVSNATKTTAIPKAISMELSST